MARAPLPSDLTDSEWKAVAELIPPPASGGRRRETDMREVVNAIRYLLATGCGWRGLPPLFPNRSTVRHYYDQWRQTEIWPHMTSVREAEDGQATPPGRKQDGRSRYEADDPSS